MTKTYKTEFNVCVTLDECSGYVPLECPVCELTIRDASDANAYRTHMCCAECKMMWAEPNSEAWQSGWRPVGEQLNNYKIKLRQQPTYLLT